MLSFLLIKYVGTGVLVCMVNLCLPLYYPATLFSKWLYLNTLLYPLQQCTRVLVDSVLT